MDTARCTEDNISYHATVFAQLAPAELERKRKALECDSCRGEAYFRKASTSGQDACFGARPHRPGCPAATPESGRVDPGGEEQDILDNPGEIIDLDLNYGAAPAHNPARPADPATPNTGRGGRYTGQGARPQARSRRRLRPILRNLIYSHQFRNSTQVINIPGRGPFAIRDFFIHIGEIGANLVTLSRGYWGMIASVGPADDQGSLWLNSGSYRSYSVLVPAEAVPELLRRAGKATAEGLTGCHLLVLGELQCSGNRKLWVRL